MKTDKIEAGTVNIIQRSPKQTKRKQTVAKTKTTVKKAGKTTVRTVKKVGEIGAVKSKGALNNIKGNLNKNLAKTLAFGAIGAISYPLVPTVLQAVTKSDWSGWKGLITGVTTVSVLGLIVGKPEILVGAGAAAGTHLLYAKGTRMIENATGTQIYRMNPNNVVYANDLEKALQGNLSDEDTSEMLENPIAPDHEWNFDKLPEPNIMISKMLASCNKEGCEEGCLCQDNTVEGRQTLPLQTDGTIVGAGSARPDNTEQNNDTVKGVQTPPLQENQLNDLSFRKQRSIKNTKYHNY